MHLNRPCSQWNPSFQMTISEGRYSLLPGAKAGSWGDSLGIGSVQRPYEEESQSLGTLENVIIWNGKYRKTAYRDLVSLDLSITRDGPYRVPHGTRVYSKNGAIQRTCGPTDLSILGPWKHLTKGGVDEKLGARSQKVWVQISASQLHSCMIPKNII